MFEPVHHPAARLGSARVLGLALAAVLMLLAAVAYVRPTFIEAANAPAPLKTLPTPTWTPTPGPGVLIFQFTDSSSGTTSDTNPVGVHQSLTARVFYDVPNYPATGLLVSFAFLPGSANLGAPFTCIPADCRADAQGYVRVSYVAGATGTDSVWAQAGSLFKAVAEHYVAVPHAGIITTFAGGGFNNPCCGDGGPATDATLTLPYDVVSDGAGNFYIGDGFRVRRVAPDGTITTIAGQSDPNSCGPTMGDGGLASAACLRAAGDLAIISTSVGTTLFVADFADHRVRQIVNPHLPTATIDTVAGNGIAAGGPCGFDAPATGTCVNAPLGVDAQEYPLGSGDVYLFLAQWGLSITSRVALPTAGSPMIRTVLSTGRNDVSISPIDASLYVSTGNDVRRKAAAGGAEAGLVEGDASEAETVPHSGPFASVRADANGHVLRSRPDDSPIPEEDYLLSTGDLPFAGHFGGSSFCGDGDFSTRACLDSPNGIFYDDATGVLYFADMWNNRIRMIEHEDQDADGLWDEVEDPDGDGYDAGSETDEADTDTDNDGCSDPEELGATPALGGGRNNKLDGLGQYDFYDVNGTKKVDAADIGLVRAQFNVLPANPVYDRSPGANPWAPGPPNGVVNGTDIGLVRASFLQSCVAAP